MKKNAFKGPSSQKTNVCLVNVPVDVRVCGCPDCVRILAEAQVALACCLCSDDLEAHIKVFWMQLRWRRRMRVREMAKQSALAAT